MFHRSTASDPFRLKPIRAARVSEVSETTAASPVPVEERINFHIGNPVQDPRLSSAFLRTALGIDIERDDLKDSEPDAILDYLGWETADRPKLDFLIRVIKKSAPYMPRGGYSTKAPHSVVKAFFEWLEHQQETLQYDTGEKSGRREIILASGGIEETLRVILFTLSSYLETLPARIVCLGCELSPPLKLIPGLVFEDLVADEHLACDRVEQILIEQPDGPSFLIIGSALEEVTRRRLRALSIERPLFFIEANNAPNHLSLAREARLVQRVIRLLSPAIFSPRLAALATVFVAGNADYLSAIENVHFNLKGTPCASDVELLAYLLDQQSANPKDGPRAALLPGAPTSFEGLGLGRALDASLPRLAQQAGQHVEALLNAQAERVEHSLQVLEHKADGFTRRVQAAWKRSDRRRIRWRWFQGAT